MYILLRKYIREKPYYLSILELCLETTKQSVIRQCMDLITGPSDGVDFSKFTMEKYSAIAKWKTAFYSFYFPVAMAMYMKELHSVCKEGLKILNVADMARPACHILLSRRMAQGGSVAKKIKTSTELAEFDALFPELVDELTTNEIKNPEIADAFTWLKKVLHYNVPYGKKTRGLSLVISYKHLVPEASEADIKLARVLGWCAEMEYVGLKAINDSFFLECTIYILLRKYIRDKAYYLPILELFLEATRQTVIGQCLDMTAAHSEGVQFSTFTMEKFNAIVKCKNSFYAFYFPVTVAMHMAGISDEDSHTRVKPILFQLAHFYQVQNDYLDVYGDPEITGKIGNDIQDNKCSWLIVKALELASDEQKEELKANYARCDTEAAEKVKAIYRDLKLEDVYKLYEESSHQEINNLINSIESAVPKEVFLDLANMVFKHEK